MQRNVLSSQVIRFALSILFILCLSACTGASFESDSDRAAPTPVLPKQAGNASQNSSGTAGTTKVALLLPMSGKGSDAGQAMMNAAQLAIVDLGAKSFELIPGDTGSSATAAANEAVRNGAKLILGPLFAADAKSVSPIAKQAGVNLVSFSTDATAANANTFILGFLPESQVNRVLEYAGNKGLKRIALIAPNDAYGQAVASVFDKSLKQRALNNGGILRFDGAQPSAENITRFSGSNTFDAVLIAANAAQASEISKSIPSNVQRLGTGLWDQVNSSQYPGLAGAWYAASSPKLRQRFETKYRETYGESAPRLASLAYDAAALAVVLTRQGQGFGQNALLNPNGFSGIDGIFRFQPNGLNERGLAVLQIGSGTARIIQESPTSFR